MKDEVARAIFTVAMHGPYNEPVDAALKVLFEELSGAEHTEVPTVEVTATTQCQHVWHTMYSSSAGTHQHCHWCEATRVLPPTYHSTGSVKE